MEANETPNLGHGGARKISDYHSSYYREHGIVVVDITDAESFANVNGGCTKSTLPERKCQQNVS